MVFWVKWAEVDICKENDRFTHRCFVIQQWQLLFPTKYWPGKASERENWVSGLKNPRIYKHTHQPTLFFCPSSKNPPKTRYPTQQLFSFWSSYTWNVLWKAKSTNFRNESKFYMPLSSCILEIMCCSHVRTAKCWAATELTRKHSPQPWNCGLNGRNPHHATAQNTN